MATNLPPGVTMSMIPGNRPEDLDEEAFLDQLAKVIVKEKANPTLLEDHEVWELVVLARDVGYEKGYGDGQSDAALEQAMKESE